MFICRLKLNQMTNNLAEGCQSLFAFIMYGWSEPNFLLMDARLNSSELISASELGYLPCPHACAKVSCSMLANEEHQETSNS